MNNEDLKTFGLSLLNHYDANDTHQLQPETLEIGDIDKHGNKHPDHDAYVASLDRSADNALVKLEKPF